MRHFITVLLIIFLFTEVNAMELKSNDLTEGARIASKFAANVFGCTGGNISPHLAWSDVPRGTKSFAITVYDPDAPTQSGFWHWIAINIPASLAEVETGASGTSLQASERNNDYGFAGYGGPCPPKGHGMHRYQFTVYAMPVKTLEIEDGTPNAVISFMLNAQALASARITATFVSE